MHLCRSWIALGLLGLLVRGLAVQAAVVYKWIDADGVVHFSDQPVPGAEKIVTPSSSSRGGLGPASPASSSPAAAKRPASAPEITQFAIVSPVNEQTITGNQPVSVQIAMEPELKPTQSITWYLNGSPVANQAPDATQFTLEDLPRGTYTLGATMVDQASGETKSADPVTFYVVRTSLLSPQRKAGT
jgi:Domain of unknown function (DUF4124)